MKNLLHPRWLFLINTLPVAIFLILSGLDFSIVRTLLEKDALIIWGIFGGVLMLLSAGTFIYAMKTAYKNEEISNLYAVSALTTHVIYAVVYLFYFGETLQDVPRWMISPDSQIYVVTFLMPTIIHALFVLMLQINKESEKKSIWWLDLLLAISIPFAVFIFLQIGMPFWDGPESEIGGLLMTILGCFVGLTFLFFIIRSVYTLVLKRQGKSSKYVIIWRVLIGILCPITGLMLNQGLIRDFYLGSGEGIFGNFGGIGFFAIALINGIFVCLPERENPTYRLALFGGRVATFTYVTYFFLVFLPFLPLSIIGILAVGLGFLMLTPLVLFIVQGRLLSNDFTYLANYYSKDKLRMIIVLAFLVLPTAITFNYLNDKKVLSETLDYIYYPDYTKDYDLNENALHRIISNVKAHKRKNNDFFMGGTHTPFLSRFYTWLVLDNMTLSDSKINKIESVFLGESTTWRRGRNWNRNDTTVAITDIQTKSEYDATQDAWLTWVDFEMTNLDTNGWQREYNVEFDLPTGCYISNYYLDMEGRREYGILAEKRAAIWIYQQITRTNRDPGLLNYVGADKVRFRVFPFSKNEVRTTGIQFLHKEPVTINIDDKKIQLGDIEQQKTITTATDLTENVVYVSAAAKAKLPTVKRKPYYHFVVDVSGTMEDNAEEYITNIEGFIKKNNVDLNKAEFNFTNKYSTITKTKGWKTQLKNQAFEGGFYLERAIEKALFNAYENRKNEYPIIVVVSNDYLQRFIMEDDFANFKIVYPELNQYYKIENDGNLISYDLTNNPRMVIDSSATIQVTPTVLAYPNAKNPIAYLPNDGKASIVLKSGIIKNDFENVTENNWKSALTMHGNWLSQNLHPETAEEEYYELVKSSFKSNVMNPTTSFISVENEAQKQMLKKKQRETLLGNKALDLGEQPARMSEPELWIVLILFGLFVLFRSKKFPRTIV